MKFLDKFSLKKDMLNYFDLKGFIYKDSINLPQFMGFGYEPHKAGITTEKLNGEWVISYWFDGAMHQSNAEKLGVAHYEDAFTASYSINTFTLIISGFKDGSEFKEGLIDDIKDFARMAGARITKINIEDSEVNMAGYATFDDLMEYYIHLVETVKSLEELKQIYKDVESDPSLSDDEFDKVEETIMYRCETFHVNFYELLGKIPSEEDMKRCEELESKKSNELTKEEKIFLDWVHTYENNRYINENEAKLNEFYQEHFANKKWDEINLEDWDFYSDWYKDIHGYRPHFAHFSDEAITRIGESDVNPQLINELEEWFDDFHNYYGFDVIEDYEEDGIMSRENLERFAFDYNLEKVVVYNHLFDDRDHYIQMISNETEVKVVVCMDYDVQELSYDDGRIESERVIDEEFGKKNLPYLNKVLNKYYPNCEFSTEYDYSWYFIADLTSVFKK